MRCGRGRFAEQARTLAAIVTLALPLLAACASAIPANRANRVTAGDPAAHQGATVVVVRHAETAGDDPRDPSLSAFGQARAGELLQAVNDVRIEAVYTTQYRRTRETGRIVAEGLKVPLVEIPIAQPDIESYSRALLERIDREHAGGAALVVGHSNTAPVLVQVATGRPSDPIAETEYDRLYLLLRAGGATSVVRARYGKP